MSEANKELVRRAAETHNARDRERFLACYRDRLLVHVGHDTEPFVVSPDEHWEAVLAWAARFEGFAESIQELMADGDRVFVRSRYRGVHAGVYQGIEPTGRTVEWDAWQVLRIVDGRIAEERMLMDTRGLISQLED